MGLEDTGHRYVVLLVGFRRYKKGTWSRKDVSTMPSTHVRFVIGKGFSNASVRFASESSLGMLGGWLGWPRYVRIDVARVVLVLTVLPS